MSMNGFQEEIQQLPISDFNAGELTPTAFQGQPQPFDARLCVGIGFGTCFFGFGSCFFGGFCSTLCSTFCSTFCSGFCGGFCGGFRCGFHRCGFHRCGRCF